jgi:hypothetical protein
VNTANQKTSTHTGRMRCASFKPCPTFSYCRHGVGYIIDFFVTGYLCYTSTMTTSQDVWHSQGITAGRLCPLISNNHRSYEKSSLEINIIQITIKICAKRHLGLDAKCSLFSQILTKLGLSVQMLINHVSIDLINIFCLFRS